MSANVSSSPAPRAQPPRSNPVRRSSSDAPPLPCITPSTVTCVMVVSFIGLAPWFACPGALVGGFYLVYERAGSDPTIRAVVFRCELRSVAEAAPELHGHARVLEQDARVRVAV